MKNKLVVVTDLGSFKAYRLEENKLNSHPRLELIDEFDTVAGHEKLAEQTTDQAGRFPRGGGVLLGQTGDLSAGERHNIELEQRKRLIKQLAETVNGLMRGSEFEICYFAAGKEINRQLVEALEPAVRAKISKNVVSNLTKVDKSAILDHF